MTAEPSVRTALETPIREVTVRFSHVDAAAIVFYPRFIEMFTQAFPELLTATARCDLEMEFHKPIMLGDRLSFVLDAASSEARWQLSGQIVDREHLTVTCDREPARALAADAHDPLSAAFVSKPLTVQAWCAGPSSRLQLSRYYEFINTAIEQWFASELERPFRQLHDNREGIPTVSLKTQCAGMPRLGDRVRIWIRPTRLGRRSLAFETYLVRDGACLARTAHVIVFVNFSTGGVHSVAVPDAVRARLVRRLPAGGGE